MNTISVSKNARVVYVMGTPLKTDRRLCDELVKIYGISTHRITTRMRNCGLLKSTMVSMLRRNDIRMIERMLNEMYVVGSDLKRKEYNNIQRHRKLGTYKGIRMRLGLPVHGQRTSTNAKTAAKLNKQRCKL